MNGWFIAILLLWAADLGMHAAKNGEQRKDKYSFGITLFNITVMFFLLYMAVKTGF